MNRLFKDKTLEYVLFLKKFINDVYRGKIALDKDECQDIDEYIRNLSNLGHIINSVTGTTCLLCFNGNYDMSYKNTEYYLNKLCENHGLRCVKDKGLNRWVVYSSYKKKYKFTCHYIGVKDIDNIYNNFVSFDYVDAFGKQHHEDFHSFYDLD